MSAPTTRKDLDRRLTVIGAARTAQDAPPPGIPDDEFEDAVDVARQGREIAAAGIAYTVEGIVPAYGMLGFLVAYAKTGKTTFAQQLAAHVASGRDFLERRTNAVRVLVLAAEDPPEYTAWLARHLTVEPGRLVFRRRPLILSESDLERVAVTVLSQDFGLVLIASWQAVVRGLIRDENDNAGAVAVVEAVKQAARRTGVPWLIDAHSGKGEDQADDADPSKAMRGASAAAAAADYTLSLRYANGTFGTQRRLSGKGRFVSLAPLTLDFNEQDSTYAVSAALKDVGRETTWRLLCETGALDETPRSATDIARLSGLLEEGDRLGGATRRRIYAALKGRPDVFTREEMRHGKKVPLFSRVSD